MIGRRGERGSGISVLAARHDDDDIYIYCLPQIDCFVVSQLFNVARHPDDFTSVGYFTHDLSSFSA